MYQYDQFDETLIRERNKQFRDQVERRLSGELTEDQFKPLRLMNGLYLQLHAYMLRVAIPYGTLSSRQLHALADIADRYDRGYGHFTTRQNLQYNWPALVDVPDMLDALADVEMHAIQTSGNCIRNVTTDQYAGAAADEVDDPRIWCELIRQWSTFHPEFSFLPRKFKIAVTASEQDRAAVRVHDIGLVLKQDDAGTLGFEVLVGGGLGRTPYVAHTVRKFLPAEHILSYLEAILRVYNRLGRRDNKYKARIKILVNAEGIEDFTRQVEEAWAEIQQHSQVDAPWEEVERLRTYFPLLVSEQQTIDETKLNAALAESKAFAQWVEQNCVPHKLTGYRIANISLKRVGGIPGDASSEQMRTVAELAERFGHDEIRVTHEQNLCLPHVRVDHLFEVWQTLDRIGLGSANVGLVTDIIACPGLDYCSLANARSIPIAQNIAERFSDIDQQTDIGELKIKISGCINACGHHHVGHIGILGVDKKGEEFYQITLGGSSAEDAALGEIVGRGLSADDAVDAVERLVRHYLTVRTDNERFLDTYRRLGATHFKEALYESV